MSPEALSAQRLYREVRDAIRKGVFPPGQMLVTSHIADRFGTSVSPVRDVLHQLLGEGLVEAQSTGGFQVPALEPERIVHLYRWQAELTYLIARSVPHLERIADASGQGLLQGQKGKMLSSIELAHACSRLFHALAGLSGNPEHHLAFSRLDARMHLVRCHEMVLGRCQGELVSLQEHLRSGNRHRARTALWHYHRRRLLNLERIFAALVAAGLAVATPQAM